MIEILQRPISEISGEDSKWNAVGNPIVYKLQRKDNEFNQVNNNGGFVQVQFNGVNIVSEFFSDDVVTVVSDNGVYSVAGSVVSRSFSGGNTLVVTDIPYASAAPGGFVNNETTKPNYRIQVNLLDASNDPLNEDPFEYQPNPTGYLLLNVSGIIRSLIIPDNDTDLTTFAAVEDANIYKSFVLGYTEVFTDSSESESIDTETVWSIFGALQIPSLYGGNMALYATFDDGTPQAKFLTKLTTPVMWRGWPFSLSAIVQEEVTGNVYFDAGSTNTGNVDLSGKVATAILTGAVDSANDTFTVKLHKTTGDTQLTEEKTIEVRDACPNPVLLMGRSSLGGPLWWMFDYSQEYTFDYGGGRKAKRLVLSQSGLSINEWESLQDFITLGEVYKNNVEEFTASTIKSSSRIGQQLYVVNQDGTKIGVVAIPTQNSTSTNKSKHIFELEIEYPEVFAA